MQSIHRTRKTLSFIVEIITTPSIWCLQTAQPKNPSIRSQQNRPMSITAILLVSAVFLLVPPPLTSSSAPTAYDLLKGYHFPEGLLPKGITGYELDESTGKFRAYLNGSCSFSLEGSYQLSYKSTIGGYISKDRLTDLHGISVKVLFFWLNIVEVVRNGDDLDFSVGIASASFSLDNFFVSPQCGCGLDCVNDFRVRKLKLDNSSLPLSSM